MQYYIYECWFQSNIVSQSLFSKKKGKTAQKSFKRSQGKQLRFKDVTDPKRYAHAKFLYPLLSSCPLITFSIYVQK